MSGSYALALVVSLAGLLFIDYRFKLAFFFDRARTTKIMLICMLVFIVWDVLGIIGDIFFIGQNSVLLGVQIGEFPIEELLFLALLNYSSLICYRFIKHFLDRAEKE
jgi:lycopene cyclase domain-containing protein